MNIEECYKPVTCQEVSGLLPKIVQGEELASAEGGENRLYLLEGHIENCDQCLSAYSGAMDEFVKQSPMSGSVPSVPMLPKALSLSFLEAVEQSGAAAPGTLSPSLRARVEQLREHEDRDVRNAAIRVANVLPAAKQPTGGAPLLLREVQVRLKHWVEESCSDVGSLSLVPTLSGGRAETLRLVPSPDIEGEDLSYTIYSGPVLTKDGRFRFALHGANDHLIGRQLECAITIFRGERVRFQTSIRPASNRQGWEAIFDAALLDPALCFQVDRKIDPYDLTLTARPSIT